jgi:hypothetical protein
MTVNSFVFLWTRLPNTSHKPVQSNYCSPTNGKFTKRKTKKRIPEVGQVLLLHSSRTWMRPQNGLMQHVYHPAINADLADPASKKSKN